MRFLIFGLLFLTAVYLSESRTIVNYDETTKDELKNQVDNLKKQAQDAIQKLMGEGKTVLANGIKTLETHLVDLESQLEKLNPQTEVGKALLKGLETLVKAAEAKLEEEIKKLAGTFYDATQDELKKQVDNLKKQAQDAIEKLKAQGKTIVAEGVKKLETQLVDLESQLEKLNPQTEVGKALLKSLEALVKGAETKLEEELKKLSGGFYANDEVRAALLKEASDMYDQINAGEEELTKTGKPALISGLEKVIKFIDELTAKVKTLKPTTDLGKIIVDLVEKLAASGKAMLQADLKKAQGSFFAVDADKEALLKIVGELIDTGKAAYEKLAKEDKPKVIDALTKTITLVKEAQADVKSVHPTTTIGKAIFNSVSKMLTQVETLLEMDLKALKGGF